MLDNFNTLEEGFIQWHGYDQAIRAEYATFKKIDSKGNTLVMTEDGRIFNTHPIAFECGWPPKELYKIAEGCYPVRWEIQAYNWEMEDMDANEYWNSL